MLILLAEDNRVNQQIMQLMVTKLGHTLHIVGDGEAAVRAVRASRYDIVLMDIDMPLLDGLAATRLIRQQQQPDDPVPHIIAVTATSDRHACEAAGMNAFLGKPIHLHDLAVMLTRANRQLDRGAG